MSEFELDDKVVEELSELTTRPTYDFGDDSDDGDEIDLNFDAPPVRCAFTTGAVKFFTA